MLSSMYKPWHEQRSSIIGPYTNLVFRSRFCATNTCYKMNNSVGAPVFFNSLALSRGETDHISKFLEMGHAQVYVQFIACTISAEPVSGHQICKWIDDALFLLTARVCT